MINNGLVALRGLHSFHVLDRRSIREVEVGAKHTRIVTPYHVIEVETRPNADALSRLCGGVLQEVLASPKPARDLYPRLADLPF